MTGEPITTGLLVSAAASTGAGMLSGARQQKIDTTAINTEMESAKLQASSEALEGAKSFRRALASQLALSSLRSGAGGSMVRQFGAASIANMFGDALTLARKQQFIDITASTNRSRAMSSGFGANISSLGGLLGQGLQSINLNSLGSGNIGTGDIGTGKIK